MGRAARQFETLYREIATDIFKLCKALNFEPSWQQAMLLKAVQDARYGRANNWIACKSGQGPGKCGCGTSTIIDFQSGERRTLKDLAKSKDTIQVACMDEESQKIKVSKAIAFESGHKKCIKITSDNGHDFSFSTDHPIYTPQGWTHVKNLKEGDLIASPRKLPKPLNPLELPEEEVVFLAYMLAEGSTSSGSCSFTQMTNSVLMDFLKIVKLLGGSSRHIAKKSKASTYGISGLRPLIRKWNANGLAKNKRIPAKFFGLVTHQRRLFLNRFWACDGYLDKDGPGVCLASQGMIKDIQTMLLLDGIQSRVRFKPSKFKGKVFDAWALSISGRNNVIQFFESVGMVLGKEKASLKSYQKAIAKKENTNTDIVPIKTEEMKEICEEMGLNPQRGRYTIVKEPSFTTVRKLCRGRDNAYISRQKFENFCKVLKYKGKYARLANNDIYWVKVATVEDIGTQPVFDLTVPGVGNFVADNIIVHNTTSSGIAGLWWCLQEANVLSVITAPTMKQCKLWLKELNRTIEQADPIIRRIVDISMTKMRLFGREDWGFDLVTATRPENAQGFHSKGMCVIADEASGVARDIIEQFKGTLTNPNSMLILTGNPNTRDCSFFDCFNSQRHLWNTMTFNAEESPPEIVNPVRNLRLEEEYGRDSDVYRVRVLGEFPLADPNCVFSSEDLEIVSNKSLLYKAALMPREEKFGGGLAKQFGLDFARYGGDENTLYRRSGNAIVEWGYYPHTDPSEVIAKAFMMQKGAMWSDSDALYVADAGGMGQGVMHIFYNAGKRIHEFHNNNVAYDPDYANATTEAWFRLRGLVRNRRCYLPADNRLIQQLCSRRYFLTKKGQFALEDKETYEKRGYDSPDRAEGVVNSFYDYVSGSSRVSSRSENKQVFVGGSVHGMS